MVTISLSLFALRFLYVFASAFQQKSVINDNWATIPATCYIRAGCDYGSWGTVAYAVTTALSPSEILLNVIFMGTGATLGVYAGMCTHNKLYRKAKANEAKET